MSQGLPSLLLLVALPWLLRRLITSVYGRLKRRIDAKIPDDMPIGGGAWLGEQLRARGLEDVIHVFEDKNQKDDVDAFFPMARTIVLSSEVHRKRDPSFWAIAGHELGHALVHVSSRAAHAFFSLARVLVQACTRTATLLIVANILYVRGEIDDIAFALLLVSLCGYGVVLFEEALASALSIRMLAKDARVGRRGLVGAITALFAAFMTYVGGFVGQVALLLNRAWVVEEIHRHRAPALAAPIGGVELAIVVVLAAPLLALSIRAISLALRRADVGIIRLAAEALARDVLGLSLVALVWDQPMGKWFPFVCVAGILGSEALLRLVAKLAELVVRLVAVVVTVPLFIAVYIVFLCFGGTVADAPETRPPASEGTAAEYARLRAALDANPSLYSRAARIAPPALHLAFVLALCVSFVCAR